FSIERFHVHHELFLARVKNALILGPNGVVITPDGGVLEESTWGYGWLEVDRSLMSFRLPSPSFEFGNFYTVATPFSEGYAHWLLDVLPRFFALEHLAADDTQVLVSRPLNSWQLASLRMLGVEDTKIIALNDSFKQVETLYMPSYVGNPGNPHPWGC